MYLIINTKGYSSVTKEIILRAKPFKGEHDKYHYCYEVYVPSTKWTYRGVRSCKDWSKDKYLGSSSYYSYKDDINESKRVEFRILSFHKTREEANNKEIEIVNEDFINRNDTYNKGLPTNYHVYNSVTVRDKNNETLSVKLNDPKLLSGEYVPISKDKITVKDKKGNYSQIDKSDKRYLVTLFPFSKDTVNVKDILGNTLQVNVNDPKLLSGEYVPISKDRVVVKDMNGNSFTVNKSEFYERSDIQHVTKNRVTVKDKDGNTMSVNINDDRYLSGELVSIAKNTIKVLTKNNDIITVNKDDPKVLSGEYVHVNKNRWAWNKMITINEEIKSAKDWAKYFNIRVKDLKMYLKQNIIKYSI